MRNFLALVLTIVVMVSLTNYCNRAFTEDTKAASGAVFSDSTAQRIHATYTVVEDWEQGMTIVIPKELANEQGLRALAEQLHVDLRDRPDIYVFVYGDKRAARLRKQADHLKGAESKFHDDNMLGAYMKNSRSGLDRFNGQPQGAQSDNWFRVEFATASQR